ncbi:hypothetical protein HBI07_081470 [Parastagonospora nodorum]|nr:hypothetical protein HBI07_081470 [Parastagonospora nodorum]
MWPWQILKVIPAYSRSSAASLACSRYVTNQRVTLLPITSSDFLDPLLTVLHPHQQLIVRHPLSCDSSPDPVPSNVSAKACDRNTEDALRPRTRHADDSRLQTHVVCK